MSTSPAPAVQVPAAALALPPNEPAPRPDPWLTDATFAVDAFLAGLRPVRS